MLYSFPCAMGALHWDSAGGIFRLILNKFVIALRTVVASQTASQNRLAILQAAQ